MIGLVLSPGTRFSLRPFALPLITRIITSLTPCLKKLPKEVQIFVDITGGV
jgi:hypothetical protein